MQIRNARVILVFVLLIGGAGLLAWFALRDPGGAERADGPHRGDENEEIVEYVAREPGTLTGEVIVYRDKSPAADVKIRIEGGPKPVEVKTGDDGAFRAKVAADVELTVTVLAPEPYPEIVVRGIRVDAGGSENLGTLALERAFLVRGIVVDLAGNPIPGATARAFRPLLENMMPNILDLVTRISEPRVPLASVKTADDGTFSFQTLPPGTYRLEAVAAGHAVGYIAEAIANPETSDHVHRIALAPGLTLAGSVKNFEGEPIAGATVTAVKSGGGRRAELEFEPVQTTTDEQGEFLLTNLSPGRAAVMATAKGYPLSGNENFTLGSAERVDIVLGGNATIEGRITNQKDEPVEGADVFVIMEGGLSSFGRTRSDEDGRYGLTNLKAGQIQIFGVQKVGYPTYPQLDPSNPRAMFQAQGTVKPGQVLTKDVKLVEGATVIGRITDGTTGAPIAGATVNLIAGSMMFRMSGAITGTTDENGEYRVEGVAKGKHVVLVTAKGHYQQGINEQGLGRLMGQMGPGGPAGADDPVVEVGEPGTEVRKDLKLLTGATVSGRVVTPDGSPVAGARVKLGGGRGMSFVLQMMNLAPPTVMTGEDGGFRISGLMAGEKMKLTADAEGWLPGESEAVSLTTGGTVSDIEITLKAGGSVEGTIHGADGRPLVGAAVQVVSAPPTRGGRSPGSREWLFYSAETRLTDAEGRFRQDGLQPGPVLVSAGGAGHQRKIHEGITVTEGAVSGGHVIALEKGFVISGIVTDAGGKPLAGARVWYDAPRGTVIRDPFGGRNQRTKSDGTFKIDRLPPGSYTVHVRKDGYAQEELKGVEAGSETLSFTLQRGLVISGRVTWPNGEPAANVSVNAKTENGQRAYANTDEKGEFTIKDLKPGSYELRASPRSYGPLGGPADAQDAKDATVPGVLAGREGVQIRLEPALSIQGVVVDEAGNPVPNAFVSARPMGGDASTSWGRSGEDGAFRCRNVESVEYKLSVHVGGYSMVEEVTAGGGDSGVRVVLKKGQPMPRIEPLPEGK